MESNASHYFFNLGRAWLLVFNIKKYFLVKRKSPSHQKGNECASGWKLIHVCTTEHRRRKVNSLQQYKRSTDVYLESFLLISTVELEHWRSRAKTLVNNMGLNTYRIFVLFNISLLQVCIIFWVAFHYFINFEKYWICVCACMRACVCVCVCDELMHVHIYCRTIYSKILLLISLNMGTEELSINKWEKSDLFEKGTQIFFLS